MAATSSRFVSPRPHCRRRRTNNMSSLPTATGFRGRRFSSAANGCAAKGNAIQVARDKVAVIALSTELARSRHIKGVYGRLVLTNGGRLSLQSARADDQALVGKTLFGATVQIPVKQIVALDLHQGCA